jgi:hypothetical protein
LPALAGRIGEGIHHRCWHCVGCDLGGVLMGARLKKLSGYAIPIIIVWGIVSAIYAVGYGRGYQRGSVAMRNAVMCVLERTANIKPEEYCPAQEKSA